MHKLHLENKLVIGAENYL